MYMSHEQLDGQNGLECDIYSFSIILWQVCTLRKPERNVWAVSDITPADAPQAVKDLALACQRKDPKARPTIAEVCDTLDKIQRESVDLWGEHRSKSHAQGRGGIKFDVVLRPLSSWYQLSKTSMLACLATIPLILCFWIADQPNFAFRACFRSVTYCLSPLTCFAQLDAN